MMHDSTDRSQLRTLFAYFILAYAISWSIGVPLALQNQGVIPQLIPYWTHYLVAYGPLLSAILVTWISEGRPGLARIGKRMVKWRVTPVWWFVALSPLVIGLVIVIFMNLVTDSQVELAALGEVHFLPPLGLGALFLWILTFGFGEETGWRGYALPRLQRNHTALSATIILALLWGLWHLPQFFYLFSPSIAIGWAFGLFAGAIVFTWLFNSTGGSVLIVAIWHGCFNFMSATGAGNGMIAATVSTLVMVWAVILLIFLKSKDLSHRERLADQ